MRIRESKLFGCRLKRFGVVSRPKLRASGGTGERGLCLSIYSRLLSGTQPALGSMGGIIIREVRPQKPEKDWA